MDRKFLDWFSSGVRSERFNFTAAGIPHGKIILECSHLEPAFPKPMAVELYHGISITSGR
jgi:hypothetical protein